MTFSLSRTLVVIPCLNEAAHLPGLMQRLTSEAGAEQLLFVVADGGSTDGSQDIVRGLGLPNVVLLDNPHRLQSAGVNLAILEHGDGKDAVVRIDAHAEYPPRYIEGLLNAHAERGADSVVVPMKTVGFTCFQKAVAAAQNSRVGTGGSAHRMAGGGWVDHGHHALMILDAMRRAGGYRPDFSHNEDAELDHRITANGGRIWLEPTLEIKYHPRDTATALYRQYTRHGGGRARTVKLHRLKLRPRQMAPMLVAPAAVVGLAGLVVSPWFWPAAVLALPACLWLLACAAGGVEAARKAGGGCAWGAGFAAAVMHLGWSVGFWREWVLRPVAPEAAQAPGPKLSAKL